MMDWAALTGRSNRDKALAMQAAGHGPAAISRILTVRFDVVRYWLKGGTKTAREYKELIAKQQQALLCSGARQIRRSK